MSQLTRSILRITLLASMVGFAGVSTARLPPAPPADPIAAAAKAEKDKAAAEKTKADQARYEDKTVAFGEAPVGSIGLELALPLLWTQLVSSGKLTAIELWQALSTKPAACLHQSSPDELILFDTEQKWTVSIDTLESLSHNTSWLGREIVGKVITLL